MPNWPRSSSPSTVAPTGKWVPGMRYLSQRYSMPFKEVAGLLTDIGTEELGHLEMVATIVHQLTRDLSMEEIEKSGFANYYVDHTIGVWPQAAGGVPFNACEFQVKRRHHHRSARKYGCGTESPLHLRQHSAPDQGSGCL